MQLFNSKMDDINIVPPKDERIAIGSLFVVMDLVALFPLAAVIMAIFLDKKMRRIQAYRIMLYIAMLDFIQLCTECTTGFITIWPIQNDLSTKVAGGLLESSWIYMICLTFVLSTNRLIVIAEKAIIERRIAKLCQALCILGGFIWLLALIGFLTPWITIRYYVPLYAWKYVRTDFAFYFAITISSTLTPLSLMSLCNYIIILALIIRKKRNHSLRSSIISSNEIRILLQSISLFTFTTLCVFLDFFHSYFLPPTKWTYFFLTLTRQICIVMIPFLNLIFNRTIRMKVSSFFLWKSAVKAIRISSTTEAKTIGLFRPRN